MSVTQSHCGRVPMRSAETKFTDGVGVLCPVMHLGCPSVFPTLSRAPLSKSLGLKHLNNVLLSSLTIWTLRWSGSIHTYYIITTVAWIDYINQRIICFVSCAENPGKTQKEATNNKATDKGGNDNIVAQTFTFRELAIATKNFRQECLTVTREGGFGRVYKGRLDKTRQVSLT